MLFLLVATSASDAGCPTPVTTEDIGAGLDAAAARYEALDGAGFVAAMDENVLAVPCVLEVVTPSLAASFHRLQGMNQFARRDEEQALASFAAAKASAPGTEMPLSLVPIGHSMRELWDRAKPDDRARAVPEPVSGWLNFDGAQGTQRPELRPTWVQVVGEDGRVTESAWLLPEDPMPPYEGIPLKWAEANPIRIPRVPVLIGSGGAAVVGGVMYAVAASRAASFERAPAPNIDEDDLRATQRTTNSLVVGSAIAGGVSLTGLTVGLFWAY